ncbi:hypothetical protein BRADI_1g21846v3 [Brachypodium distachyon]|uniref:KIB1-4 beta-propeller domain-containing protein n=1 Tax=Brachypodium distachyon TaxID=15368 RepID=A0A0Q3GWD1_BRADI|nr:hypothetical protein BRADI_1g21846v3 [Brachypodium distachyon]
MSSSLPQPSSPWADLLPELTGRVIARLPFHQDRARFRAVCRPWHSAVRHHVRPELPWIIRSDGSFVTLPDRKVHHRVTFPGDTVFVGASNNWLVLYRMISTDNGRRSYLLHDPFTDTSVPLPALDRLVGKVSHVFEIRNVLLRSTQDDIVAVTTNNLNYPIILCRPGKWEAWFPAREEMPYASIFDVVFCGDALYGITHHGGLVMMDIDEDDDGTPAINNVEYVIMPTMVGGAEDGEGESGDNGHVSGNDGDEADSEYNKASSIDQDTLSILDESGDDNAIADHRSSEDKDNGDQEEVSSEEDEEEVEDGFYDDMASSSSGTTRHLFVSNGKLLMLKRQQYLPFSYRPYNLKVEVLEADVGANAWVLSPTCVTGTLFVSAKDTQHIFLLPRRRQTN